MAVLTLRRNPFYDHIRLPRGGQTGSMLRGRGEGAQTHREIHDKARSLINDALIIKAAARELNAAVRAAYRVGGDPSRRRQRSPIEQVYHYNHLVQGLHTLAVLHQRRAEQRGVEPANTARMTRNLWNNVVNNTDYIKNPLSVTHPRIYRSMRQKSEALLNLCQGNSTRVRIPPPPAAPRARRTPSLLDLARNPPSGQPAATELNINLDNRIQVLKNSDASEHDRQLAFDVLGSAIADALEAAKRSPRAAQAIAIAREGFASSSDSPIWNVLTQISGVRSYASTLSKLTTTALRMDVEASFLEWAERGGNITNRANRMLTRFVNHGGLTDEAQTQMRNVFEELDAQATSGVAPRLSATQTRIIRTQLRASGFQGRVYTGALAALSWLGFALAVRTLAQETMGPLGERSTRNQLHAWGAVLTSGRTAVTSTQTFMNRVRDINVARDAVQAQASAASRLFTQANTAAAIASLITIAQATERLDRARDEYNDIEATIQGVRLLGGCVSLLTIVFPALAPVGVVIGLAVVVLQQYQDAEERLTPKNLRFFKEMIDSALELKGRGERGASDENTLADHLRMRSDLHQLKNQVSEHEAHRFWWPLVIDERGRSDPQAQRPQGGAGIRSGTFQQECLIRLGGLLSYAENSGTRINELMYGTPTLDRLIHRD